MNSVFLIYFKLIKFSIKIQFTRGMWKNKRSNVELYFTLSLLIYIYLLIIKVRNLFCFLYKLFWRFWLLFLIFFFNFIHLELLDLPIICNWHIEDFIYEIFTKNLNNCSISARPSSILSCLSVFTYLLFFFHQIFCTFFIHILKSHWPHGRISVDLRSLIRSVRLYIEEWVPFSNLTRCDN